MEQRKIKEMYIKVRDNKGEEGWVSMTEFSKVFMETVGEAINLTFKEIGKELQNLSTSDKPTSSKDEAT